MNKRIFAILIFCVAWLGFLQPAVATSIGSMPAGPVASAAGVSNHRREWVRLELNGDLLVGFPANAPVRMITLYAPSKSEGHVILRWVESESDNTTLLLTAPNELRSAIRRTTIYFKWDPAASALHEKIGSTWERRQPFLVRSVGLKGSNTDETLTAFVTKGLGPFWMERDGDTVDYVAFVAFPSDSPLARGSWLLAILSWTLPLLVFTVILSAARFQHRLESRHEKTQ